MAIWPIDDPYGGETGWPDRRELHGPEDEDTADDGHAPGCGDPGCDGGCVAEDRCEVCAGPCRCVVDFDSIELADLEGATRADMWIDEGGYDSPDFPF
jgi:hypothetical protein